jgi:outer membrane assembly lipoprotein YfiO
MRRAVLVAAIIVIFISSLTASNASAAEPKTWEMSSPGHWQQVDTPAATTTTPTQPPQPVPTLDDVERLLRQNKNREAKKLAIDWVVANPHHPQRDRGLFLVAQSLYQYGNRLRAYYYLDELMDEYPESSFYQPALEKQFQIADRYLKGYKRRFLGIPTFHAYDEAVEMLFRIQHRSPGSQIAERALLRTANYYYQDAQYDFAADTYAHYLRSYPRSPLTPRVRLRQAYSMYAQFRGPRFDATPAIDAREQLRELIAQYSELAQEENLPALVQQIDQTLVKKLFVTADFYRRTREPVGAAYTYQYVVKAYPNTDEADQAALALKELPQWAVNAAPNPAITPGYAPGTQSPAPRIAAPAAARTERPGVFAKPDPSAHPDFR